MSTRPAMADSLANSPQHLIVEAHTDMICKIIALKNFQNGVLASASRDGTIRIWDEEGQCIQTFEGHAGPVHALIELVDGTIASGSEDCTIKIWDSSGCINTLRGHSGPVYTLDQCFNGKIHTVVSGSGDKTIKIWDPKYSGLLSDTGFLPRLFGGLLRTIETEETQGGGIHTLAVLKGDKCIASASLSSLPHRRIEIWILYRNLFQKMVGLGDWFNAYSAIGAILAMIVLPEGHLIASCDAGHVIFFKNLDKFDDTKKRINDYIEVGKNFTALTYFPSNGGSLVVGVSSDGDSIKVWNKEGQCIRSLGGLKYSIFDELRNTTESAESSSERIELLQNIKKWPDNWFAFLEQNPKIYEDRAQWPKEFPGRFDEDLGENIGPATGIGAYIKVFHYLIAEENAGFFKNPYRWPKGFVDPGPMDPGFVSSPPLQCTDFMVTDVAVLPRAGKLVIAGGKKIHFFDLSILGLKDNFDRGNDSSSIPIVTAAHTTDRTTGNQPSSNHLSSSPGHTTLFSERSLSSSPSSPSNPSNPSNPRSSPSSSSKDDPSLFPSPPLSST